MTSIPRDSNQVRAIAGVLNTDGVTPTAAYANPANNSLKVQDASTGAVTASADARRDDNSVTTMLAVSSADGSTVELAVNSSGQLLIQST